MRYLGDDDLTRVMGIGYLGEVRQGPDGSLHQWMQGIDGLGNPIGFWKRLKRLGRKVRGFARRAVPLVQRFAPFVPGGAAALTALRTASPYLRQAGVLGGGGGLGALYQAPDGSVYEVAGLGEEDEQNILADDEDISGLTGTGFVGEIRRGPDGQAYQWVQGVDGLGNPIGFWKRLKRLARRARGFARRAIPIVQKVATFVPGGGAAVSTALRTATPYLRRAGVLGGGLGALYQAADGSVYEVVSGLGDDDHQIGLEDDEELTGLEDDDELTGLEDDEELQGMLAQDDELDGFGDDELTGLEDEEAVEGVAADDDELSEVQGYVPDNGARSGIGAYQPAAPPGTRWFVPPGSPPDIWRPLW